ncbi:MAG: HNH endonuclease family protein [Coriobacteriia bacterium]|nr:HNH endonuclease family protein [Coriobacteriia bacterium]
MPASSPPYRRAAFGSAWSDVDGNGCDTRDDILARDLTATVVSSTCKVLSGTLADPYTGKTVAFTRGSRTSADVQIDHIVSLSDAWRSGAYAWTPQQRLAFANDPLNLRAVSGPANNTKGDKGPSLWMPHVAGNAAFDCTYATEYTQVLVKYHLPAPPEDAAALAAACK